MARSMKTSQASAAVEPLGLTKHLLAWEAVWPGLVPLVIIWSVVGWLYFGRQASGAAVGAFGLIAGIACYSLSLLLELPFEHWYRLGPSPGTRLRKPVGILPSGLDLETARTDAVVLFTVEGHHWPHYNGNGVYALSASRIRERKPELWSGWRLLATVSLNKLLRSMVVPALVLAVGALYAWVVPDALAALGLPAGSRRLAGSLAPPVVIVALLAAFGFFLGFVHLKVTHMIEVYRAVLTLQKAKP